jgi:hypothetical protein
VSGEAIDTAEVALAARGEAELNPIGYALKLERERRGLTLLEVSRISRVPLKSLEALEDGRFDDLPGDVFSRGFLRSYARADPPLRRRDRVHRAAAPRDHRALDRVEASRRRPPRRAVDAHARAPRVTP